MWFRIALSPSHSPVFTPNEFFSSGSIRTGTSEPQINDEPTRHLARVATIEPSPAPMSLQRVVSPSLPSPMPYIRALQLKQLQQQTDDDKAMEDFFREILASPKLTNAPLLSVADSSATEMMSIGSGGSSGGVNEEVEGAKGEEGGKTLVAILTETGADDTTSTTAVDWANEIEMQSILDTMVMMSSSGRRQSIGFGLGYGVRNPCKLVGV